MSVIFARCGLRFFFGAALVFAGAGESFAQRDDLWPTPRAPSSGDSPKLTDRMTAAAKKLIGKGPDPAVARRLYQEAGELFRQAPDAEPRQQSSRFAEAAERFEDAAGRWPDSALEEDALFFAGEAYFFGDRYTKANDSYERLLKKSANTKHLDVVEARRFAIAQYWLELDDKRPQSFFSVNLTDKTRPWRDTFGHAVRVFDRIRIDDPTGKLADDATLAAGNAWFAREEYIQADSFYSDLRKAFPSSEHQFHAHLLGLKAKLESYQGPDYSGVPLDEAEKLLKQIHRQFPHEVAKEREYLARAYGQIRFQKAEREWKMARYYDGRNEFGPARFYYAGLIREYEETPYAQLARERVDEIQGEPDLPNQPLEWLVEMFPEKETVQPMIASPPSDTLRR